MSRSVVAPFLTPILCLGFAVNGNAVSMTQIQSLNRAEQTAVTAYARALLQAELKTSAHAFAAMSLNSAEVKIAERLLGASSRKDLKSIQVSKMNPVGIEIIPTGGSKILLTAINQTSFLIETAGRKGVWTPSLDFEKDVRMISSFLNVENKTSKWWNFSIINSAHATIGWVGVVIAVAVVALAYMTYREMKKTSDVIQRSVEKNISGLSEKVDELGNRLIDEVGDKLSDAVSDGVKEAIVTNPAAVSGLIDQSSNALKAAQSQITDRVESASESQIQLTH